MLWRRLCARDGAYAERSKAASTLRDDAGVLGPGGLGIGLPSNRAVTVRPFAETHTHLLGSRRCGPAWAKYW